MVTDMPEPADTPLITTLQRRDGLLTTVHLKDGSHLVVQDIAWGYDLGDGFAHITTNISPGGDGLSIDFFYSDAVVGLSDTHSGDAIAVNLGDEDPSELVSSALDSPVVPRTTVGLRLPHEVE